MEFKDYYQLLGVEPKATADEIKKAYKRAARRYHPDVSKEKNAEQKFKEVAEAYEVLKNEEKRREYDQLRTMGAMGGNGQFTPPPGWESATHNYSSPEDAREFSDFFESLFGRKGGFHRGHGTASTMRMDGEDAHAELALLLEEVISGCEQTVQIRVPQADEHGVISYQIKKLKVKVPPGTGEGSVLRVKGQGTPGFGGGNAGDLLLKIKLAPHPLFAVEGRNVSLVVPVLPWEAALGCKITIPTLQHKTRVTIPANSQSGQKLRLADQGLPGDPPGDFLVVVKVVMPDSIDEKAKSLYQQLAAQGGNNPRPWERGA